MSSLVNLGNSLSQTLSGLGNRLSALGGYGNGAVKQTAAQAVAESAAQKPAERPAETQTDSSGVRFDFSDLGKANAEASAPARAAEAVIDATATEADTAQPQIGTTVVQTPASDPAAIADAADAAIPAIANRAPDPAATDIAAPVATGSSVWTSYAFATGEVGVTGSGMRPANDLARPGPVELSGEDAMREWAIAQLRQDRLGHVKLQAPPVAQSLMLATEAANIDKPLPQVLSRA